MRAVVQRVSRASVAVEGQVVAAIGAGLLVLLAVAPSDGEAEAAWMVDKVRHLRVFPDADGKMNRSVLDLGGEVLVVSQFTLYGNAHKGRRPSFVGAARPEVAVPLYEQVARALGARTGVFGAHMVVSLDNDGPVTLLLDSP